MSCGAFRANFSHRLPDTTVSETVLRIRQLAPWQWCAIHIQISEAQPNQLNSRSTINIIIIIMPPKKAPKGKDKKKAPPKPKPKRKLYEGEVQQKHLGASHGDVQRVGDKVFK
jgi:hypothetical protein